MPAMQTFTSVLLLHHFNQHRARLFQGSGPLIIVQMPKMSQMSPNTSRYSAIRLGLSTWKSFTESYRRLGWSLMAHPDLKISNSSMGFCSYLFDVLITDSLPCPSQTELPRCLPWVGSNQLLLIPARRKRLLVLLTMCALMSYLARKCAYPSQFSSVNTLES